MLPLKKASFLGRGCWDAAPCGRVEGEGSAVAPAAADATDWVRACWALSATRNASRAAVFVCSISSSNRRRHASRRRIVWSASSSAHWARAAAYAKSKWPAWAPRLRELWGCALLSAESQGGAVVPYRVRGGQLVALPRGWRELASRRPRVRWRLVRLRLCASRRVDPLGWWVRLVAWWSVFSLVTGTRRQWFPPSRVAGLERALPVSWASRLGCVEDLSLPRVARFLTGRHVVACCLYGGQRKEGVWGKVAGWERRVKKLWKQIYCCGVPAASSDNLCASKQQDMGLDSVQHQ